MSLNDSSSTAGRPDLSAAVVFGEQRARAERCLRHLLAQTALSRMEIVIVDLSRDGVPIAGMEDPAVRWRHRPDLQTYGAARAECIRQSRAGLVAFVEDHCYADRRWAEEVINAFEKPVDMVNYALTNSNPERFLCRTFLMTEYGRWIHPAISGEIPISACNNVAYRKAALEPYADRLDQLSEAEYVLHRHMQAAGSRVWLAAGALVGHENWTRFGQGLQANCDMKRLLAVGRAEENGWSAPTRIAWALGMALTPPIHMARLARSLVRRPTLWPLFWASVPLMTVTYSAGAWSEAMGYLFGDGGVRERFRDLEISVTRER